MFLLAEVRFSSVQVGSCREFHEEFVWKKVSLKRCWHQKKRSSSEKGRCSGSHIAKATHRVADEKEGMASGTLSNLGGRFPV